MPPRQNNVRSPTGLSTSGQTGQVACGFVIAGFLYDNATALAAPCPADTYSATTRAIAAAASCTAW